MRCLVTGATGFIGRHLVARLKAEGHFVRGIDRQMSDFGPIEADELIRRDLRLSNLHPDWFKGIDEVYQLAADMGGAGYIFSGDHDARVMRNSSLINLNVVEACRQYKVARVFFSSSACVYASAKVKNDQAAFDSKPLDIGRVEYFPCREQDAYPANPDSDYGWEKLFSERLYQAYARNYGLKVRIARLHNIFGEYGTWRGGREKAPAAICRKVAETLDGGEIPVWGDGEQTRSFLHVSECIEGILRLTRSDFEGPVNIGSDEIVTINQLVAMVCEIAGKKLTINHIDGPLGVRGRNSDNDLIWEKLAWEPRTSLLSGLRTTYVWIEQQVKESLLTAAK